MTDWTFPIHSWQGEIPEFSHPGAFGCIRKHDIHTGVDLYVPGPEPFYAVEAGRVVATESFTGPEADSPWWLSTKSILVKGASGVVCYGEVAPIVKVGDDIRLSQHLGSVAPVLKEAKTRKDIPGHSNFMLHLELYKPGTKGSVWWYKGDNKPEALCDPTDFLKGAKRL